MSDSLVSNRTVTGSDRGDEAWQGEGGDTSQSLAPRPQGPAGVLWGRVVVSDLPQVMNKGNTFKLHTTKAVQETG